jgi:hypothetical protein
VARAIVRETENGDPRVLPLVGKALEALRTLKLNNSARSRCVFPATQRARGTIQYFDNYWHGRSRGAEFFEQATAGKAGDAPVFVKESGEKWSRIQVSRSISIRAPTQCNSRQDR